MLAGEDFYPLPMSALMYSVACVVGTDLVRPGINPERVFGGADWQERIVLLGEPGWLCCRPRFTACLMFRTVYYLALVLLGKPGLTSKVKVRAEKVLLLSRPYGSMYGDDSAWRTTEYSAVVVWTVLFC